MGCCSSKHPGTPAKQRSLDPAAQFKHSSARPAIPADDGHTIDAADQPALHSGWHDRTDELRSLLLHQPVGDKLLDEYIAGAIDVAKNSFEKRIALGQPAVVQHLCHALAVGPPSTAQKAAQALKLLTFCHDNHRAFMSDESGGSLPTLIKGLSHEEYRVSVCCLAALCNLSATPLCVTQCVASRPLLAALERVLLQKRLDPDPQANATQLLLNLCAIFCFKPHDSCEPLDNGTNTIAELKVTTRGSTAWGDTSERFGPSRDSDAWTKSTRFSVQSQPTAWTVREATITQSAVTEDGGPGRDAPAMPLPDCSELMSTVLRVLSDATALEREARENCIEVVLALLHMPGTTVGVDSKVAEHFVAQGGLTVIAAEACRDGALASTLVLISDILRLFARTHVRQLFRAPIIRAVAAMLAYVTKRSADERQVDVDVKLAGLSLVQLLHTEGEPLAGVVGRGGPAEQSQLAHEVVHHLPACLAAQSIAVQLAACQLMVIYQQNPHARGALRGGDVVRRLVELNAVRHPLTAAPAVQCVGIMSELHSDNADAVIRANGMHAMLCTLEEDCPAQAQRHALVSISKVLQRAHANCLSPELQRGRMIPLAVSVLMHTAHSGVTSQAQWSAWCCRALRDAANVDHECAAKVASVMSRKPDVLKLIGVSPSQCTPAVVLPALARAAAPASGEFLAVVADLQVLEEAVSTQLIRGHHPMLKAAPPAQPSRPAHRGPGGYHCRAHFPLPPMGGDDASSSHILPSKDPFHSWSGPPANHGPIGYAGPQGGLSQLHVTDLANTQDTVRTNRTNLGSTQLAHDLTDSSFNVTNTWTRDVTATRTDLTGGLPEDRPAPDSAFLAENVHFQRARGGSAGGAARGGSHARSSLADPPVHGRLAEKRADGDGAHTAVPRADGSLRGSQRGDRSKQVSADGGVDAMLRQRGAGSTADVRASSGTPLHKGAHKAYSILAEAQCKRDDRSESASAGRPKSMVFSEKNVSLKSGSQKDPEGYTPPGSQQLNIMNMLVTT